MSMYSPRRKRPYCLCVCVLLCAALLTGCAAEVHSGGDAAITDDVSSSLPAPTGELLIYAPPELDGVLQEAKGAFRNQYPEVELTLRSFRGGDAADAKRDFCDILNVELLAGRGPDLVLYDDETLSDPYKTMEAGIFRDIAPFFAADPTFDRSQYCEAAFEGGIFRGEQLFVPIEYRVMGLFTTEEALEAFGMTLSEQPSFAEWAEQLIAYTQTHTERENRSLVYFTKPLGPISRAVGLQIIDYESGEILVRSEEFRLYMELYQAMAPYFDERENHDPNVAVKNIQNGQTLYSAEQLSTCQMIFGPMLGVQDTPRVFPFPSLYGEGKPVAYPSWMAAIRAASDNQQNAYRFLKILLAPRAQDYMFAPMQTSVAQLRYKRIMQNYDSPYLTVLQQEYPDWEEAQIKERLEQDVMSIVEQSQDVVFTRIYASQLDEMVRDTMEPWLMNQKSYESCVEELYSKLELYLYE